MSKNRQPARTWSLVLFNGIPLAAVGLAAMMITFATLIDVARINGLPFPLMFPIVVDVGMIATMVTAAQFRLRGVSGQWLAYAWFFTLSAVSVIANGTHALTTADMTLTTPLGASLIGAVPSATLLVITHLVMKTVPDEKERAKLQAQRERATAAMHTSPARPATIPAGTPALHALAPDRRTHEPLRLVPTARPAAPPSTTKTHARQRVVEHWAATGSKPTGAQVGEWLGGKSAKTGQRLLAELEAEGAFHTDSSNETVGVGS